MKKLKYIILIIFTAILSIAGLTSCGGTETTDSLGPIESGNFRLTSFSYNVEKKNNENINELSYVLTFDIVFDLASTVKSRNLTVRITGAQDKNFKFTLDSCNTQQVVLSTAAFAYPYALLNYVAPEDKNQIVSSATIKMTTSDLISDINDFISIDFYNEQNVTVQDPLKLTKDKKLIMDYKDTSSSDIINYVFDDFSESYTITSIITKSTEFEIPSEYKGYPVKSLEANTFTGVTTIEKLTIPNSVQVIPEGLLSGMGALKEITLPYVGVRKTAKNSIYYGLGALFGESYYSGGTQISQTVLNASGTVTPYSCYVPEGLYKVTLTGNEDVPYGAFSRMTSITTILFNGKPKKLGASAFADCTRLVNFTIPESVEEIGDSAFSNAASNTIGLDLKLPSNLTTFGSNVFSNGANINIEINNELINSDFFTELVTSAKFEQLLLTNVSSIPANSFKDNTYIKKITIPDTVIEIGEDAFLNCTSLETVEYSGSYSDWVKISFENMDANPMSNEVNLISSDYSDNIIFITANRINPYSLVNFQKTNANLSNCTAIGEYAFYGSKTSYIGLPDGLTTIGEQAFAESRVNNLVIPTTVSTIGVGIIKGCSNIDNLSLPSLNYGNSSLGYFFGTEEAEQNDQYVSKSLKEVTLTNVSEIPDKAFYMCSGIERIDLTYFETIGDYAFYGTSLEYVLFPSTITSIGTHAFDSSKVSEVEFNTTNLEIQEEAFMNCKSLKSISLAAGIKSVGDGAFKNCTGLTKVEILYDMTIGTEVFKGCTAIKSFGARFLGNGKDNQFFGYFFGSDSAFKGSQYVPQSVSSVILYMNDIPDYAFYGLSNITSVETEAQTIGESAFEKCSSISKIKFTNVNTIAEKAFCECEAVEDIRISDTITEISSNAFKSFGSSSTKVYYQGTLDQWANINFENEEANPTLNALGLYIDEAMVTELVFTKATIIKKYSFINSKATSIVLSNSCTSIGDAAFKDMEYLSSFTAGESLETIGIDAFRGCGKLIKVELYNKLTRIYEYAFMSCVSLDTLIYHGTASDWAKITLDNRTSSLTYAAVVKMVNSFGEIENVISCQLDSTVKSISQYAFYQAPMNTVYLSSSVKTIGENAFGLCQNLTDVYYEGTEEEFKLITGYNCFSDTVTIHYNTTF